MIEITQGNLLEANVEAIVNTVNSVGVMGKGIALQFKKAFPDNFKLYKKACDAGEVEPGKMFVVENKELSGIPKFIINFPTKRHWRGKSKVEDIEAGLVDLVAVVKRESIRSIAIPPLGCGNGGLQWSVVRPLIEAAFDDLPDVKVELYEPAGAPKPHKVINRTSQPDMTPGRAAILCLMNRYSVPGYVYRLSMLEIQKLAYFMQEAGQPLKLNFEKGHYGPYADNLRKVLERIDGHFIEGYGDGAGTNKPETPITLLADGAAEAEKFLENDLVVQTRFERVAELIEGFETPYGMELLSSIHWVINNEMEEDSIGEDNVIGEIHRWNDRKKSLLDEQHIRLAYDRLKMLHWLT